MDKTNVHSNAHSRTLWLNINCDTMCKITVWDDNTIDVIEIRIALKLGHAREIQILDRTRHVRSAVNRQPGFRRETRRAILESNERLKKHNRPEQTENQKNKWKMRYHHSWVTKKWCPRCDVYTKTIIVETWRAGKIMTEICIFMCQNIIVDQLEIVWKNNPKPTNHEICDLQFESLVTENHTLNQ